MSACPPASGRACDRCLRRAWMVGTLAGHLDRTGARVLELLELDDNDLVQAVAGRRIGGLTQRLAEFDAASAVAGAKAASLQLICRCDPSYPGRLLELPSPPAVLHVAGDLDRLLGLVGEEPVAIVGTRRPTSYGVEVARSLGGALAAAGLTVVSGMAHGIDSAAHAGAVEVGGATVAVLAAGADRPYPPSRRELHRRITSTGAVISELPPGSELRRWMFPARNRLIAALSAITVVVEAGTRSGALLTASWARSLGRVVCAVPGRITTPQSSGPNVLLQQGAHLVTGAQDVLDALYGAGSRTLIGQGRPEPDPELRPWLDAVAAGHDTAEALARAGLAPERTLEVLSELELSGHIRRKAGGRFAVVP